MLLCPMETVGVTHGAPLCPNAVGVKALQEVPHIGNVLESIAHVPVCPVSGEVNILYLYMERSNVLNCKEMAEKAKKKSFIFNVEWQEVLLGYPSEVRLEVYDAIIEYVVSGTTLELKPMAKMAFSFIKKEIDYNASRYNAIVAKRSEAGKKAMSKRYNKSVTNLANDNKSNKCYQDVANLTVNDNVNVSPNGDIKETLSNESAKKEAAASSPSPANPDFEKFNAWLEVHAPFCSDPKNFPSQITEAEFQKLKGSYSAKQIAEIIEQIENRKDLRKRYTNLYRTVLNWAKREYGS